MKITLYCSHLLCILFISLATCSLQAQTVDKITAGRVARNFLYRNRIINDTDAILLSPPAAPTADDAGYYIFNTGNSAFVIISASKKMHPVLAYSDKSTFSAGNPEVDYWLSSYSAVAGSARKDKTDPESAITAEWQQLKTPVRMQNKTTGSITPLLTTTWNQSPYYNNLCPYDILQHRNAITGCVATAMAQIMKYWNWPATGSGSHSYTCTGYGLQSMNFNAVRFDWTHMPDHLAAPDTAIATLMYAAGVSVNMDYTTTSSGAWVIPADSTCTNTAWYALKTYFRYKPGLVALGKSGNALNDSLDTDEWMKRIHNDLDNHQPVLFAGFYGNSGHCWVCDGYDNDTLLHFNWGWGGMDNGYFRAFANYFPQHMEIVTGIAPDTSVANNAGIRLNGYLSPGASPVQYGKSLSVCGRLKNEQAEAFNGTVCAQLFDENGNLQLTADAVNERIAAGDSSNTLCFIFSNTFSLVPGVYKVRLFYRTADEPWQAVGDNDYYLNYTTVGIANDTNLLVSEPVAITTGTLHRGKPATFLVTVSDLGLSYFLGTVSLGLYSETTGEEVYSLGITDKTFIPSNESHTFTLTDSNLLVAPGKYMLMVKHRYYDSGASYTTGSTWFKNPVEVSVTADATYYTDIAGVYPNPANDYIIIDSYAPMSAATITDMSGKTVKHYGSSPAGALLRINIADIAPGIYLLHVFTSKGDLVKKLTVLH